MTSCYACGGTTERRRIGIASLEVCRGCGFGRLANGTGSTDYWARNENPEHELAERYWQARLGVFLRALAGVARARGGPGRLVDIGGGVGLFAAAALEQGWDAYSADVSQHAAKVAATRLGTERSLTTVPRSLEGTCDLVTLWCVVAHVPDPRQIIVDGLRLLKPGGRLLLSTPNFRFQAPFARVAARLGRPVDFVASDHLLQFTPAALEKVLASAGVTSLRFVYWGSTADCLFERRLARLLVPTKRLWNRGAWELARLGAPPWGSELQVEAVAGGE